MFDEPWADDIWWFAHVGENPDGWRTYVGDRTSWDDWSLDSSWTWWKQGFTSREPVGTDFYPKASLSQFRET